MKAVIAVLIALSLAGCATSGNVGITDPLAIEQIKIGETTKETVKMLIGPPSQVLFLPTEEQWFYHFCKANAGLIGNNYTVQSLTVVFGENGIVKNCAAMEDSGRIGVFY